MNSERRKADVERAYRIQAEAGIRGFAQYGAVGLGLAAIAHHQWPTFRCAARFQTQPCGSYWSI